jgi:hypothetical protein
MYGIEYTTSDQSYSERSKHFIFAVGITESMRTGWPYFLRASRKFAESKLTQDPSVSHSVSCITFTQRTAVPFQDQVLYEDLFHSDTLFPQLPFTGEKTSFSSALGEASEIIERHTSRIPVVLILISDGDGAFPHRELKRLCEDSVWKKLDSFWAVGFGNKALHGTLMGIAQYMVKGYKEKWHFRNPKDFTELVDHFDDIANEII